MRSILAKGLLLRELRYLLSKDGTVVFGHSTQLRITLSKYYVFEQSLAVESAVFKYYAYVTDATNNEEAKARLIDLRRGKLLTSRIYECFQI
jgi:hypothetical protein